MAIPRISTSLAQGLAIQMHPKMLLAILLPFLIAIFSMIILWSFAWTPLSDWLLAQLSGWSWFEQLQNSGGDSFLFMLTSSVNSLLSFISLSAIGVVIGLAAAAIIVTPIAVKYISKAYFPHLAKKGQNANTVSIANAVKVSLIFVFGWLITLPLWFFPLMPIVLPLFWAAYAFSHMSQVDAIVEHATAKERQYILTHYKKEFWGIGFICALLTLIPLMGFVVPVFSIILCTHFGLSALEHYRETVIQSIPPA
ncbi:EI24 domain-containing protein [Pelistega sp. NLN82]|uniref:EI24 domain-containing protein n=1 Tax=Pelistega ratti TaxID=2652177 RepID=A0A6L9Y5T8_9BURK|nr:EI24 domain-containing protein [Pelistega ratti]NEN75287.1 EI24 domain-containing protein [Pelistega ratti]